MEIINGDEIDLKGSTQDKILIKMEVGGWYWNWDFVLD